VGAKNALDDLGDVIGNRLTELGYWGTYDQPLKYESKSGLRLDCRAILLPLTKKLLDEKCEDLPLSGGFYLVKIPSTYYAQGPVFFGHEYKVNGKLIRNIEELDNKVCTVFMAGVIMDLLVMHSAAYKDMQFWNNISELLRIQDRK